MLDNNMNFQTTKLHKYLNKNTPKIKVNWYGDDDNRSYRISLIKYQKVTNF